MKPSQSTTVEAPLHTHVEPLIAIAFGAATAAFALFGSAAVKFGILAAVCLLPLMQWVLSGTHRWIIAFLAAAILLPPLPFPIGDSGPHPALLLAGVGVLAGILRMPRWRGIQGALPLLLILFTAVVLGSVALAGIYSGSRFALISLARALLFAISPYVFLYTLSISGSPGDDTVKTARLLFRFATAVAVFACLDFYFQLPAPSGYEPQFIWLGELVLRRAQGLFYEASTLGNFCAFFLVMILAGLANQRKTRVCSLWEFGLAGVVFGGALVFSYSRASLLNVLCAGMVMPYIQRVNLRWILVPALGILGAVFRCIRWRRPSHKATGCEWNIRFSISRPLRPMCFPAVCRTGRRFVISWSSSLGI